LVARTRYSDFPSVREPPAWLTFSLRQTAGSRRRA
jgi:hypothetical protein